jgi:hypothetical protein
MRKLSSQKGEPARADATPLPVFAGRETLAEGLARSLRVYQAERELGSRRQARAQDFRELLEDFSRGLLAERGRD